MFSAVGEIVRSGNGSAAIVLGIILGVIIVINIVTYLKQKHPQIFYRNRRQNRTPTYGAALTNFQPEPEEPPARQDEVIEMNPLAPISIENENAGQSTAADDGMETVTLTPNGSEGSTSSV